MVIRGLFPAKASKNRVFLGSPEAEAEALESSRIPLIEVYEDFHDLAEHISSEKFIVLSRKGCGKSAFGEVTKFKCDASANHFCSFIKHSHINLETIVQIGKESGSSFEKETLFRWIIFTNLLNLILQNEAVANSDEYKDLKIFCDKNSGYIKMKEFETTELIKKSGFELSIEYFKRFFKGRFNREIQIKQEKAPFYKILPHLEFAIQSILATSKELTQNNSYILFFDDLDIGYNNNDQASIDSIMNLLRVAKDINNETFGKFGINAKVVILLRNDISRHLATEAADMAKLFTSYSTSIDWYQSGYGRPKEELELHLRKFINNRIALAFDKIKLPYDKGDPWQSLVKDGSYDTSSFDYVVDYTLFRPRDLLLFFLPLDVESFNLPLDYQSINILLRKYSDELIKELKNELLAVYTSQQIDFILNALTEISTIRDCSYRVACEIVSKHCVFNTPDYVLADLFERSIIGALTPEHHFFFKCREQTSLAESYSLSQDSKIILQKSVKLFCSRRQHR